MFKQQNRCVGDTLDKFVDYVANYIKANDNKNVPKLASIHKMKGSEADRIFIYNYNKFPYTWEDQTEEDKQQELNLQYVAITRAKKSLFLCVEDKSDNTYSDFCKKLLSSNITFNRL